MTALKKNIPVLRFPGFKEEWMEMKLETIIESLDAGVSVNSEDRLPNASEYSILKTSAISNGRFHADERKAVIDPKEIKRLKEPLTSDTIVISRMNTPLLVGANAYIKDAPAKTYLPDRLWQVKVKPKSVSTNFLAFHLASDLGLNRLRDLATGTSNSMKNITKNAVLNLNFLFPSIHEQEKIASFLSSVDDRLEQLLEQHSLLMQYKKGSMQHLFSQKIRFKDVKGKTYPNWEKKLLGDIFENRVEKQATEETELLSVTINNGVKRHRDLDRINNSSENKSAYLSVKKGDIVYNSMRMWQGASGISYWDGIVSPAYTVLKIKEGYHDSFFAFLFKLDELIKTFQKHSQGLTSDTWNLKYNKLKNILVTVPCYAEQIKIANFLSAVDEQINNVKQQIALTQQFKKGLIKQLFA